MFRNPSTDLIVVLLIVLLIWGPKRLPGLGRQLGQGIRDFRDAVTGGHDDDESDSQTQITQSSSAAAPASPAAESRAAEPAEPRS
jgi:sec-independent protein translocase protein TatA